MTRHLMGCIVCLVVATPSAAQVCIGLPDIRSRAASAEGGLQFAEGSTVLSAGVNGSLAQGAFGGVSVQRIEFDDLDASATALSLRLGGEVGAGQSSAARVCPVLGLSLRFGPDFEAFRGEVETSGRSLSIGASVGGAVRLSDQVRMIPFGGASLLQVRNETEARGVSDSETDTGGALEFGLGFEFNRFLVVRPNVAIPFGFEGSEDAVFGLSVAIGFGPRDSRPARPRPRGTRRR